MSQIQIFIPLLAMVLLSLAVGMALAKARLKAVHSGLSPTYFRFNRGSEPPEELVKFEQHYNNLFELPVLFYIACLAFYVTTTVDVIGLTLAWIFVASRLAHAYVHLSHNSLLVRRRMFMIGFVVLCLMWLRFILAIA